MNNGLFKRQLLKETSLAKTSMGTSVRKLRLSAPIVCSPVACSQVACSPVVCSPVACSQVACSPVACSSNRLLVRQLHLVPDASSAVTCSSVVCSDSFTSCRFGSSVVAIRPSNSTIWSADRQRQAEVMIPPNIDVVVLVMICANIHSLLFIVRTVQDHDLHCTGIFVKTCVAMFTCTFVSFVL